MELLRELREFGLCVLIGLSKAIVILLASVICFVLIFLAACLFDVFVRLILAL